MFAQKKPEAKAAAAKKEAPKPGENAKGKKDGKEDAKESESPDAGSLSAGAESKTGPNQFWIVEFDFEHLRMIAPRYGIGAGRVYWYMVYTLTNTSDEDRDIYVSITATSDNNHLYSDLYLPSIEKAVEKKEGEPLWGKADEFELLQKRKPSDPKYHYTKIKAGEKRRCVAVFNRLDPNANKITVSVSGLSNEVKEAAKEDGTRLLEERIRELQFERPGDEFAITMDSFRLVGKEWVRRQVEAPEATQKAGE